MSAPKNPPETVWISIPLDLETAKRLRGLSRFCDADEKEVAASLLHDVLRDDEEVNIKAAMAASTATLQ
jgi:bacterioferritin (cytochrome b1)